MAVVIRLQRAGGRNRPFYRVVAADSRSARDGRFLEKLGYYNPLPDPSEVHLEVPRIKDWVSKGARLSESVMQLLRQFEKAAASKTPEESKSDT